MMNFCEDFYEVTPSGYQLILLEAWRRGLEVLVGKNGRYIIRGGGIEKHFQWTGLVGEDVILARRIARNKRVTKSFVALELGLYNNLPRWKSYTEHPGINAVDLDVKEIGYPLVVKKVDGSKGDGVFPDLNNKEELIAALSYFKESESCEILLEEHVFGKDCRVYVVGEECVSVTHRVRAEVTGDGETSIKNLIVDRNFNLSRTGSGSVDFSQELMKCLDEQGFHLNSIPLAGENVLLSKKNNTSLGGMAVDITDDCPQEVKDLAINIVKGLPGISHAGVDIIVPEDPRKMPVVLEVNLSAEIGLQRFRKNGKKIPQKIVSCYFPESKRIKSKVGWCFDWRAFAKNKGQYSKVASMPNDERFVWRKAVVSLGCTFSEKLEIVNIASSEEIHGDVFSDHDRLVINMAGDKEKLSTFIDRLKIFLSEVKPEKPLNVEVFDCKPKDSMVGFRVKVD